MRRMTAPAAAPSAIIRAVARALPVLLVLAAIGAVRPAAAADDGATPAAGSPYLGGRFLVAEARLAGPPFVESVILLIDHDATGAFGIVVNRVIGRGALGKLLDGFGIDTADAEPDVLDREVRLHFGGPVEPDKGFVLHSPDFEGGTSKPVTPGISMTAGAEVLDAMARGEGPERSLIAVGYAGWGPGQLELEIARGDWLEAEADAATLFGDDPGTLWERLRDRAGLSL